jgi:hypothetical protein
MIKGIIINSSCFLCKKIEGTGGKGRKKEGLATLKLKGFG